MSIGTRILWQFGAALELRARFRLSTTSLSAHFPRVNTAVSTKKSKRNVQGVPQSQTAALPRPQGQEKTDKSKQAQTEQTYEKH